MSGRVTRTVDSHGLATLVAHDALNQVTKMTDPLGGETTFTYDGNGNVLTLTDARGKTTTWTYNNMDRVATRTDPLSRTESFTYDLNGNPISWTDRKGQVTTYTYDALDRATFIMASRHAVTGALAIISAASQSASRSTTGLVFPGDIVLTVAGGTFPKVLIGAPRALGAGRMTTVLSAAASRTGQKALRTVGRFFSPIWIGYGVYLAGVETHCLAACAGWNCAY